MSNPSQKKLAQKAAKRKAHNKLIRLRGEAARRAKQSEEHTRQKRLTCKDMISDFLYQATEFKAGVDDINKICDGRIEQINHLKKINPDRFIGLTTSRFESLKETLKPLNDLVKTMMVAVAEIEAAQKNNDLASEMRSLTKMMDQYGTMNEQFARIQTALIDANAQFDKEINREDVKIEQQVDELFDAPTPVEEDPEVKTN